MAGSNRSATYTLYLNSNVRQLLIQTEQSALALDKAMHSLQSTMAAVGIGLAAREILNTGKEWIQGAADYETAMLRIKNASKDATEGLKNQLFITSEVDKFKIDLQTSADAYGAFLLKIKNSGLTGDEIRRMHDNILVISKVAAIPQAQMDATVRDIGIMLGEGVLEARHLRALAYVHPQIIPFLADEMGIQGNKDQTKEQALFSALSSGKLTKAAIDSHVLVDALEKYRESVEGGLPETLKTIQSETNDLNNKWLELKNTIVMDLKPELVSLFKSFEEGIHWIKEHKGALEALGVILVKVGAWYAAIKITVGAYRLISGLFLTETIAQTAAFTAEATAAQAVATALAEINANIIAMNQQQVISGLSGQGMVNAQLRAARAELAGAGEEAAVGAVAEAGGMSLGAIVASALGAAVVVTAAVALLEKLGVSNKGHGENAYNRDGDLAAYHLKQVTDSTTFSYGNKLVANGHSLESQIDTANKIYAKKWMVDSSELNALPQWQQDLSKKLAEQHNDDIKKTGKSGTTPKTSLLPSIPKRDSIRGNHVTNIHIDIKELNGLNKPVFQVKNRDELSKIENDMGDSVVKILSAAVNDSQLVANNR